MGDVATVGLETRSLHPFTGAEVAGLDLAGPLSAGQRSALERLLAERGVLVFRDQRLDARSFAAAVEGAFGELMPQQLSQFTLPDFPIVGFVSNPTRTGRAASGSCTRSRAPAARAASRRRRRRSGRACRRQCSPSSWRTR